MDKDLIAIDAPKLRIETVIERKNKELNRIRNRLSYYKTAHGKLHAKAKLLQKENKRQIKHIKELSSSLEYALLFIKNTIGADLKGFKYHKISQIKSTNS